MRQFTAVALAATYLCLALIVALLLWRNGGGWAAAVAALVGGFGLCLAAQGLITQTLKLRAMRRELESVREAQRIMLAQMEQLDARMGEMAEAVNEDLGRSEALEDEIQILEGLVEQLGDRLEARVAASAPPVRPEAPVRQTGLIETVRDALAENRVDLYLQPIVALPQRRTVFYESYSRLRDATGRVLTPSEYLPVAEAEGLVSSIDNLLLFRCVQIVRRLGKQDRKVGIFCNISLESLADETFFPQFLDLLAANRDLAGALIFELGQEAYDRRGAVEVRNMAKLGELGFRFSIDKVVDLDLDLQDLARSDVKFLKVSATRLLDELVEADDGLVLRSMPDLAAQDFSTLTRRFGVELVAEKVESERQIVDILELDILYGQGHLFGEPRAIRDAVLTETEAPEAPPEPLAPARGGVGLLARRAGAATRL
jgi:cyclic-di-GMP phosphodiesterase TipF (flagellum assembly factor)